MCYKALQGREGVKKIPKKALHNIWMAPYDKQGHKSNLMWPLPGSKDQTNCGQSEAESINKDSLEGDHYMMTCSMCFGAKLL